MPARPDLTSWLLAMLACFSMCVLPAHDSVPLQWIYSSVVGLHFQCWHSQHVASSNPVLEGVTMVATAEMKTLFMHLMLLPCTLLVGAMCGSCGSSGSCKHIWRSHDLLQWHHLSFCYQHVCALPLPSTTCYQCTHTRSAHTSTTAFVCENACLSAGFIKGALHTT